MALIPSARHTPEDLSHWSTLSRIDARLGAAPRLTRMGEAATDEIRSFAALGPCYASVSWGKDSVVVASLIALAELPLRLVWMRCPPVEDPDSTQVRDLFLRRFPRVEYSEVVAPLRWYEDAREWLFATPTRGDFTPLARAFGPRYISGVRSEESSNRKMREAMYGVATRNTCAPITRWKAVDVFAWLARHDLPIHPAYGCSFGGVLDRRRLRVDEMDSPRGKAFGSEEWERFYYAAERRALDARKAQDLLDYAASPGARRVRITD